MSGARTAAARAANATGVLAVARPPAAHAPSVAAKQLYVRGMAVPLTPRHAAAATLSPLRRQRRVESCSNSSNYRSAAAFPGLRRQRLWKATHNHNCDIL